MKRFTILGVIILLLVIIYDYSSTPSLQLINLNFSIVNDKSKLGSMIITEGDKKGQELVATALYYEFTIKNIGNKSIGGKEKDKNLQIEILPNTKLENASKEAVGFNIFNPSSYDDSGLGYGSSFITMLRPEEEGKFVLFYDLGLNEQDPQAPLMLPSAEKLNKLQANALDGYLVVRSGRTQVFRFDLINNRDK